MRNQLAQALELANKVEVFPLERCGPSDDPDKQTAYIYGFREAATRFVGAARRLGDELLSEMLLGINLKPETIEDASVTRHELLTVIDAIREIDEAELVKRSLALRTPFVDETIMAELRAVSFANLDSSKLIQFCEELNFSYTRGNYLSCLLLIRAVMNHVPPIFGARTFSEVVAQSGRSVKRILEFLDDGARPLSDFHNHVAMRARETLPSRGQVESYRGSFEMLISEVITRGQKP